MQIRPALEEIAAAETPAVDLTEGHIRKPLASGGTVAHKRFGALSRFLDWCHDERHIKANPCHQIARSRPKAPHARAHLYVRPAAMARLWRAAERLPEPVWRDLARFLIAMPCRRGEAARMDWAHLDLTACEWRQPEKTTKNRDSDRLHLQPLVLDVLRLRQNCMGYGLRNARLV